MTIENFDILRKDLHTFEELMPGFGFTINDDEKIATFNLDCCISVNPDILEK